MSLKLPRSTKDWAILIASLIAGHVFVASSIHKIADPPDFAKSVLNYKLVPWYLITIVAIYLPWAELLGGLALITGLARRGGACLVLLLSLTFVGAIGFNLYRGHPTFCGCFSKFEDSGSMTDDDKFAMMRRELALNSGLIVLAGFVLVAGSTRRKPSE